MDKDIIFENAIDFLKLKGLDTEKYVILDKSEGGYLPQIPIATWLTEFCQFQVKMNRDKYVLIYEQDLPDDITDEEYSEWYSKSIIVDSVRMGLKFNRC